MEFGFMADIAVKKSLMDEFMEMPSNRVAEILNGELVSHPRPAPKHAFAYSSLTEEILGPFQKGRGGPGGWIIIDEPELHLGEQILVPDLAGWRKERMPALPETAWFETVPDWVCEIISPSTGRYDRGVKREIYADKGVQYLWFLDPLQQTLEAFQLREGQWVLLSTVTGNDEVALAPFAAVPFPLSNLWFEELRPEDQKNKDKES